MNSIRLVGLGAMTGPRRRGVPKSAIIVIAGVVAWLPFVLFFLWLHGVL